MRKLIHENTKKNRLAAEKLLKSKSVSVSLPYPKTFNGIDALKLAQDFLLRGLTKESLVISNELTSTFPTLIDTHLAKLNALIRLEYLKEASELAQQLLKAAPTNIGALTANAQIYMLCNQPKKALALFKKTLDLSSKNADLFQQIGECFEQQGEIEKAIKSFRKAILLSQKTNNINVIEQSLFYLAGITELSEQDNLIIDKYMALAKQNNDHSLFSMAFAKARFAKKQKNIKEEIQWLQTANQMMRLFESENGKDWDRKKVEQRSEIIKKLINTESPSIFNDIKPNYAHTPILIMAMPRSGTTLIEQILGTHPEIGQVGESRSFSNAIQKQFDRIQLEEKNITATKIFPNDLNSISENGWQSIIDNIIEHEALLTNKNIFVNKHLANHLYAGIVINLFPKTKCIYLKRNSLDNCLSVFQNQIVNATYSTDIKDIIHAQGILDDLALYWQKIYPEKVYCIEYEELVGNGEKALPPLVEFLGFEWQDEMLKFNQRSNLVRTPSANQVREKLNTKAIDKWKAYESLLAPILKNN